MKGNSLDPRVNRIELPAEGAPIEIAEEMDQWQTYEVFHQQSRGDHHKHVGIVHAPSPEAALVFAKEQFARRMKCVNLWVVRTADVYSSEYEDADMFEPSFDKSYREFFGYKNTRELINAYRLREGLTTPTDVRGADDEIARSDVSGRLESGAPVKATKAKIIIGKKS